jgi:hypothetical protein
MTKVSHKTALHSTRISKFRSEVSLANLGLRVLVQGHQKFGARRGRKNSAGSLLPPAASKVSAGAMIDEIPFCMINLVGICLESPDGY